MEGKLASILLLILLLVSTIVLAHNVQPVKSDYAWTETIYIRADGSIQPSTAPISSVDNVTYTLTDNITGNVPAFSSAISIQRDNITIDGADHTLKGTNASHSEGIYLSGRSNVTIKNMKITAFFYGIYLDSSSSNSVSGNNITANNGTGIYLYSSSNSNSVSGNNITANNGYGILLYYSPNNTVSGNNASANSLEGIYLSLSSNNTVSGNTAIANEAGIMLYSSSNNIISANNAMANVYQGIEVDSSSNNTLIGNNASTNSQYGILFDSSSNNTIYHNNFMNNTYQVSIYNSTDTWDNGYPSGGNYWSDYNGTDLHGGPHQNETGSDGIGDTPYSIDVENKDNYPLMQPWSPHYTRYSWPTFHHDESHSGYSESPAPGTNNKLWNYTTGNGVDSSPAVVGGRVYVGSGDYKVYCLDASTGAQVWNYTTGSAVYSSPAVADGRVYVGSGDYKVYCLDASTGAQVWNYTTGNILASAPAVAGGRVCVSSYDGRVYCLDASTGAQVWNYTTGNYVFSSPAVADGVLYVGSGDGSVYAFGKVLRVPEDYATIQAAINAATPGATVWIAPGVYHESLVINKTITLIGKPGSEPIFNGGGSGIAITIVSSGSGSTIAGITITSWDQGILVDGANGCKIYDNIMSLINNNGVVLQGTGAVSNQVCGNMFEQDAVAIDVTSSSSSNVISQNIISLSSIGLRIETSGNTICENMISENQLGINIVNSNNNAIYHNNFMDNTIAFQLSNSTSPGNSWDNGYPSGGNYWSTWTGPDKNSGPDQNILGVSDGIVDTPYTVAVNNKDNYPLAKPFQLHNVGIATVTLGKTVVGRGYCCNITLIIVDYGLCGETFNMAIWVSQLRIDLQPVVLADRSSTEINFTWDTTGFLYGNYTVACVADVVPDETLTADNDYVFNVPVHVGVPGDVSGTTPGVYDGITNMKDIAYLVSVFNTKPSSPNWQPNADVNNDGLANMKDIAVAVYYFNQHE